jgi:hypothetical protein
MQQLETLRAELRRHQRRAGDASPISRIGLSG